jgi:hypothetical protein
MSPEPAQDGEGGPACPRPPNRVRPEIGTPDRSLPEAPSHEPWATSSAASRALLARLVIHRAGGGRESVWLFWDGPPDLAAVNAVARLQLVCRQSGDRLRLEEVSEELAELLELCGLRRELEGQPKGGEEPIGFQERMDS